ncbi:hypothetical protein J2X87_002028 [Pseudomonas synxantha]|uniref:Uncharacterized protein n=1 Tax=Pseudomonas synxantha TaxID=47883 RepID=A0ACC6JL29_9PSED|nr:hypothetical protein [Pseudomonas synxantha]
MWERACSRRRRVSQRQCLLTDRFREQARSHSFCIYQKWKLVLSKAVRPAAWLAK